MTWMRITCLTTVACLMGCASISPKEKKKELYSNNQQQMGDASIKTPSIVTDLKVSSSRFKEIVEGSKRLSIPTLKRKALITALERNGGDVVVDPLYYIELFKSGYRITITGRSAHYSNIRMAEPKDLTILEAASGKKKKNTIKVKTDRIDIDIKGSGHIEPSSGNQNVSLSSELALMTEVSEHPADLGGQE